MVDKRRIAKNLNLPLLVLFFANVCSCNITKSRTREHEQIHSMYAKSKGVPYKKTVFLDFLVHFSAKWLKTMTKRKDLEILEKDLEILRDY